MTASFLGMQQIPALFLAISWNKQAAMVGGGMFNSGLMHGGMGAKAMRQGKKIQSLKFKSLTKAFRPPKNPNAAVNPTEIQRLKDLQNSAAFGGKKLIQGVRKNLAAKTPTAVAIPA